MRAVVSEGTRTREVVSEEINIRGEDGYTVATISKMSDGELFVYCCIGKSARVESTWRHEDYNIATDMTRIFGPIEGLIFEDPTLIEPEEEGDPTAWDQSDREDPAYEADPDADQDPERYGEYYRDEIYGSDYDQ